MTATSALRTWAEFVSLGKARPVFRQIERALTTNGIDESFRVMLHIERYFMANPWAREIAIRAYAHQAEPALGLLMRWVYWNPGEPRVQASVRHGWGWVADRGNPIPQVWKRFDASFREWWRENPMPMLAELIDESEHVDSSSRLVSPETAAACLRAVGVEVAERTVQHWCQRGTIAAVKSGCAWGIPLKEVRRVAFRGGAVER